MTLHKDIVLAQRHAAHTFEYADAAARAAAAGLVPGDVGKLSRQLDNNSLWMLTDDSPVTWVGVAVAGAAVTSVNTQTGVVVLDADDIADTATNVFATPAEMTKLAGIETAADVTDAANVDAAGAVMNSDTSSAAVGFVIDEDDMVSDSATKVPTQQSVKAYVDASGGGAVALDDITDVVITSVADGEVLTWDSGTSKWVNEASAGGADEPPFPMAAYTKFHAVAGVATMGTLPAWGAAGTQASDDTANGPWFKFTSAATTNAAASGGSSGYSIYRRDYSSVIQILARIYNLLVTRIWIGCFSADPSASDTPAVHIAAFRFSTAVPDTNWMAITKDGTTATTTDTGVPPSVSDETIFEIAHSGTDVKFYINGVLKATHTTNLPGATTSMGARVSITTLENVAKAVGLQYLRAWLRGR